jgi:hypothetical protein
MSKSKAQVRSLKVKGFKGQKVKDKVLKVTSIKVKVVEGQKV